MGNTHRKPMLGQHAQKTNAWATRTENQCLGNTHRKPMHGQHAQKTNAWATRTENQWLGKTHRKPMLGQHELHRKNEDELLLHSACLKSQQITKYSSLLQKS
jgi:hypothetical protein